MSQAGLQTRHLSYFGKIPARGDFIKGSYNPQVFKILDTWLSQTMESIAEDALWKTIYDRTPPIRFVCLGSRSKLAISGSLLASRDAAQRRYPLVMAAPMEVRQALDFMTGAPLLLQPFWDKCLHAGTQLVSGHASDAGAEVDGLLRQLDGWQIPVEAAYAGTQEHARYGDFICSRNLLHLEQMLNGAGQVVSVRRVILALGLLLQPVMASAVTHLDKGLTLPLPVGDGGQEGLVAALWLDFIAGFLHRADFELAIFLCQIQGQPRLVIGFNGLSAKSLQSVVHPQVYAEHNIDIDNAEWVEDSIHSNYALYKLVSYLEQPQLPLEIVLGAFREVFIG